MSRVSRTSVWVPILLAALIGFAAALAVAVVVALSWRPDGVGM